MQLCGSLPQSTKTMIVFLLFTQALITRAEGECKFMPKRNFLVQIKHIVTANLLYSRKVVLQKVAEL